MRVKVGTVWFEAAPNSPVMIELTPADKANIGNMIEGATRYAEFHQEDQTTSENRLKWMDAGASKVAASAE